MYTIVYGGGSIKEMFLRSKYNNEENIFATTHSEIESNQKMTLSLADINKLEKNSINRIIICSQFVNEIINSLTKANFDLKICFFFNPIKNDLIACESMLIPRIDEGSILYAFYDLAYDLPTYDAITFVILAEQERINQNKKYIKFVIVPDSSSEKENGITIYHDHQDFSWRIEKIIKPLFYCLKSFIGIEELTAKEETQRYLKNETITYPQDYFTDSKKSGCDLKLMRKYVDSGLNLSFLDAPNQAKLLVDEFVKSVAGERKVITITIREYWSNAEDRNSNIEGWAEFIHNLNKDIYCPILVRDTYNCTTPLPPPLANVEQFPLASVDFHLRLALYQKAYINMGINNGPLYSVNFLRGVYSIGFLEINDQVPCMSRRVISGHGFTEGENLFLNDNPYQITVWKKDTYENINHAFVTLINKINSN